MKKIAIVVMLGMMMAGGCAKRPEPLTIDSSLTEAEKEAGVFTPEIMWKMGRVGDAALSPDGSMLAYTVTWYNVEKNRGVTVLWLRDMISGGTVRVTDTSSNSSDPQWSADGSRLYFLSDRSGSNQIWSVNASGSDARQVSDFGKDVEGYGISPDGTHLFHVRRVQCADRRSSDVYKDMPDSKARIYDDIMCRHWNYWDEGEYLHIFVGEMRDGRASEGVDIIGADKCWDAPLAPYFDMTEIAWSPDGTMLAYTCKPLEGADYAVSTDSDIFVYMVGDGETRNICKPVSSADGVTKLTHKGYPFVGYDKYPVWSPDGHYVAFRSQEKAGYESDKERLFVFDCHTAGVRYLTPDFDYNAANVVWEDNETLLFAAPIEGTHQICRLRMDGSQPEVLTHGDHDIKSFTVGGGRIVATLTKISQAAELFEVDSATGALTQITEVNGEIYDNIAFGKVEKRWVKTTDGKQMLVWVILPPDFDPAKRYPTLLYCEGGPQSVVSQFWSYRWNFQLMAARGYVIVAPNRRGVPSFGQEWLEQISGDYSGQNIRDYLSAIDDVAKEPWCDEGRLGCVGASYGGYSVFYLAGVHEKRFKAMIAHCGIFNFESMYGETEELFFLNNDYGGPYWDKSNATAVRSYANSPHKLVSKWDTPILIFTGEYDFRIPYTQSLQAFTAARLLGVDARLVEFENEGHQVFRPQNSMVWNREFFGWLDRYLKE
ncbi:MAG: S9 family peptidase [Alistipes sp.]|nr:S9 family peptidase [Alistipes sp.]